VGGVTVGMIQTWSVRLERTITPVYELNPDTTGEPVDNVPGNIINLRVTVNRVDLYTKKMEQAFGNTDINMLSDQRNPFEIVETWKNPDGSTEMWMYEGCWFSRIERVIEVMSDRIIKATGELVYIRRRRIV